MKDLRKKVALLTAAVMLLAGALSSCGIFGPAGGSDNSGGAEQGAEITITDEDAMNIALSRVPGATKDHFTRFEKELDDNHWIYEGEIVYKGIEYEFEIEACNGNILEWEIDN